MALDLNYDPDWKGAASGIDLNYDPNWKPAEPGVIDKIKGGLTTAKDYGLAIAAGAGEGVANTEAGIGTFIQAPAANTLSGVMGARALADRGLTALSNHVSPGSAELNKGYQEAAQMASQFAAEERAKNADSNIVARLGVGMQDDGRERVKSIQDFSRENNPELVRQQQEMAKTEGFFGALEGIKDNPMAFTHMLARSAPDMAAGAGIAKGAAVGLAAAGKSTAAQVAGASTAGIMAEALSSANQTREGVYQQVAGMPFEQLANSPRFNEILAKTGDATAAREALANELADQAPLLAGAGTAAGSVITNKLFGGDTTAKMIAGAQRTTGKEVLKNIGQESVEEGLQGVPEELAQYGAVVQADPNSKFDLGKTLAENMAAGAAMGGGGSVGAFARDNWINRGQETPPGQLPALPDTGPISRGANVAMQTGAAAQAAAAQAADVLGVPEEEGALSAAADVTDTAAGAADPVGAVTSEAKAQNDGFINLAAYNITTPDPLKPNDAPLSVDDALFELDVLQARADKGKLTPDAFAQSGIAARLDTAQAMTINEQIKAGDTSFIGALKARLGQSGTAPAAPKTENKSGPTDMQNRDRSRAASVMQMQKIAQNPDYELASIARDSNGAPMVATNGTVQPQAIGKKERVTLPDGTKINTNYAVVEADSLSASHFADGRENPNYGKDGKLTALNNGRTAGLVESYGIGKANGYRAALEADTDGHGIPREVIAGMKAPVLVRLYDPATVDQANLGARSNQASALGMGTAEQASSDAAMLDSMDGLNPDENGDFATSRDFIKRFMARLPQTEQANMVDADGQLAPAGYARIRNAVLAKAYGNSPVLRRMTESLDDNMRNIGRALMQAAPEVAKLRQDVKDGALFDADITPDLLAAVEELARLKDSGRSVSDYLAQTAMFDGASPEARDLLQFLADNMRRPRKIAEFIQRYAEALRAAGNPNQGSLLGEQTAPTKREIINVASEQNNAETQTDRAAAGQPSGKQAGTEGNEEAGRPADKKPAGTPGNDGRAPSDETRLSRGNKNPKNVYRAYPLTASDRAKLLKRFPPKYARVVADHLTAEGLRSMDLVIEGPASGAVIGESVGGGIQSLIVSVNGKETTGDGTPFHITWSAEPGIKTGTAGDVAKKHGFTRLETPIDIDLSDGPAYSAPLRNDAALIFGDRVPPNDKPVVMVYGGSFNPIHEGHVGAARDAKKMIEGAGYKVDKVVVIPSPQHLLVTKSGTAANLLGHRAEMARKAFSHLEGFEVADEPSRIADANEGVKKPKRADAADWVQEKYPGATIVSIAGEDTAPGNPPGFPSLYLYETTSGKSRDGYFYLALPRDEASEGNISSSKIRKNIDSDKEVPAEWMNSNVTRYYRALAKKSNEIAVDGNLYDLDAKDFGTPFPKTIPDGDPRLNETYAKDRHAEIAASFVTFADMEMPRQAMWDSIVADHFKKAAPAPASRKPVAYVMGGGGASGKGTMLKMLRKEGAIQAADAVHIDADEIKSVIPEYGHIVKAGDSRAAAVVHEESSMLAKRVRQQALDGRYDVILDVTLANKAKGIEALQELKELGYEINLFGVNIEPENAISRAISRAKDSGRWVPLQELLKAHAGFSAAWESYWPMVDQARLYDTTDGQMNVAEKVGDTIQIKHKKAYNRFAERRFINESATTYREVGAYRGRGGQANDGALAQPGGSPQAEPSGRGNLDAAGADQNALDQGISPVRPEVRAIQEGGVDEHAQPGEIGTQGKEPGAVQGTLGDGPVEPVREGDGGRDSAADRGRNDGDDVQAQVAQPAADGARPEDERRAGDGTRGRAGRNAGIPAGNEWVGFPPETGTLGIPRADMPQIKGDSRGALIQFLSARGIENATEDAPAESLRPSQAEFSTKKALNWGEVREGVDRSVLVSSDGYILDGHHQWIAALAAGENVKAIRFNAPIDKLMAAVFEFPSVRRSEGASTGREQARADFKAALAELGALLRQINPGLAMLTPEEKTKLMPTLVRLFEAGIRELGYTMKELVASVKKAMRASDDPFVKKHWNKIDEQTYREAANQAIENVQNGSATGAPGTLDLFEKQNAPRQGNLFDAMEKSAPEVFEQADKAPAGDMADRTDAQLLHLAKHPRSEEKRAAAVAELKRRGIPVPDQLPPESKAPEAPKKRSDGKLSKRAENARQIMAEGGYWRKQLETQYTGGEKFETRLRYKNGGVVPGFGYKTFAEMQDAGLLMRREVPSSTVWAEEWGLRSTPLEKPAEESSAKPENQEPEKPQKPKREKARRPTPAGRDIPPKTGQNYAFGDDDLTYAGSWFSKAKQNVEAVELVKALEAEGRQATREEQAALAKFIGWGSSEIANSIFGKNLDKSIAKINEYEAAIAAFDDIGSNTIPFRHKHYWTAWSMISGTPGSSAQMYGRDITRDMVEKAKPADMSPKKWGELRDRLKAAMTAEEWAEASRSTQYAHYTSKSVVKAMWGAMERMGFKGGTILEPGAGIGVFPGLMPAGMATNSAYTGIEFDSITGAILKQLFPDERVLVESFVDSKLPAGFFDVAAGNPPFNATKILSDPKYKKHAFALHDYFFAKTIDLVKPGGLVMFVTSRYTMDKLDDKARAYLAERADLVGAIRLPQTAFKKNAGTEVVTDVLFLRKKVAGESFDKAQPWAKSVPMEVNGATYNVNEYFAAHPEMVLGTHSDAGSMYADKEYTVLPREGDIEAQFVDAANTLPESIYVAERGSAAEAAQVREIDFNPKAQKEGNYYVTDAGVLMQREGGVGQRVDTSPKTAALLKDFVVLRDALKQAHYDQLNDSADWEKSLAALQKSYRAFVKKHGRINQFTTYMQKVKVEEMDDDGNPTGNKVDDVEERRRFTIIGKIDQDPDYTLVSALESFNEDTGEITDGAFLTARVLNRPAAPKIDTPADALLSVLNDSGKVDIDEIAARSGVDRSEALLALGPLVYDAPGAGWQTADEYLSGNVKRKLEEAKVAAKSDRRFERNVEALMAAQPAPVPPSDITVSIGMNWIPEETYAAFLREKTGVRAKVIRSEHTGQWAVDVEQGWQTKQATQDWGTPRRHAGQIMLAALTGAPIRITETQRDAAGGQQTVFLADETEAANQKVVQMRDAFREWIWQDAERADTLTRLYNDKFNTIVPRSFNGSHLTLPGKSEKWNVFDHVKRGAWRIIQNGNTYLAHAVGSGKAQPLDAKVLTPSGWKLMGDIVPGDMVVAADGSPTMVEAVFPQGQKEIFRVEFSDGSSTECCDEHLWLTQTYRERSAAQRAARLGRSWPHGAAKVRSLAEIRKTLVSPHLGAKNHSIPIVGAVQFSARPLPLDAYVLGALLGDGGLSGNSAVLSSADQEIIDMVAAKLPDDCEIVHRAQYDYTIAYRGAVRYAAGGGMLPSNPVINALRDLGVFGLRSHEKHIPDLYLFNSTETRVALLQGILDTDGRVEGGGRSLRFTTTSPKLADGVVSVVQSLGGVALRRSRSPSYTHNGVRKIGREAHELTIALPPTINPFRLRRKAEQFIPRTKYAPVRYITNVVPVGRKPAQCILVAHKDHLYVTDDFIVTHNTFQMIISAMEQKRLGLIQKPMMVVPNHMLKQFASEWQDLYPAARLMVADEANFTGDNRRRFVSRVALSDLDGVIITHSAFKLLDLDPEFKQKIIEQELDYLRAALIEAGGSEQKDKNGKSKSRDPKVKQIEKKIERMEQKLEAAMSGEGKDKNVRFDEMGVDMLYVDEAHEFRKLSFATQRQVKGIDSNGSDKAFDLHMKVQWLRENKNPKRNLVMASGTPVTNTLAEIYSVQRFMDPDVLAERGLDEFDQWASMFGAESTNIEPDASGKYGPVTRFNKFVNVSELTQMFREFADVLTSDYLAATLGDKRPSVEGGSRAMNITPKTDEYIDYQNNELRPRMERSRQWKLSRDEPNNPDPIIKIIGDGRLAAIDMRFADPSLPSNPDSKLNRMIDEIIRVYKETADYQYTDNGKPTGVIEPNKGATQIVFSDIGFGAGAAANRGFNMRAWFEKRLRDAGIPPAHVAFMSDNKKAADKLKLFKALNTGKVRIVVGSSKNMGTGVNAQQRLIALHHLDAPWYPADLEQREGRIVRQGNKNKLVQLYAYAMKGSYDEQMWSTLARKQFFIDQALSGDPNIREIEDLGEASQFEIAAAMMSDDPRVLQLAGLKADAEKLRRLYQAHEDQRGRIQRDFDAAGQRFAWAKRTHDAAVADAAKVQDLSGDKFVAKADGKTYTSRKEWGAAVLAEYKRLADTMTEKEVVIGSISGFDVTYNGAKSSNRFFADLSVKSAEDIVIAQDAATDPAGVGIRASNAVVAIGRRPSEIMAVANEAKTKQDALYPRLNAPFPMYEMLMDKEAEARKLEAEIVASGQKKTGIEREQELEDAWAERTGAITPMFSRGPGAAEQVTVTSKKKIRDPLSGTETHVALSNGKTYRIARLNATESMGLPGWHDVDGGYLADTEQGAIDELVKRASGASSFSRGNGAGMAVRDLQATVDRVSRGFTNLPKVHVLKSPADLSTKDPAQKALRDFIRKAGAWEDVEGATHQGEIYLFASGMADELRAEHVLAVHEVTHYGLRGAAGKGLDAALQHIWLNNQAIRKEAAEARRRLGLASNVEAVEEIIAEIPADKLAKLNGWRKLVKAVRDWLNKAGATRLAARLDAWMKAGLDEQQKADLFVADLVNAARNFARKGKPNGGVMMDGTRLADGSLAEDVEKQEKWLTAEAKMRGYADIEDLLAKNYPLFEKLAELWRKKNPADALLSRVVKEWKSAENPPVPGKPFMVYRLAKNGEATLSNVNAADAEGLAAFLMSVEDYDSPISSQGDTVFAYEVTADEFGKYAAFNKGKADTENKVGMMAKWGGHWLSFPAGANFKSRLVGSFALNNARAKLEELHGKQHFDDVGSIKGAAAIREVMYQDFDGANLPRLSRKLESNYEVRPETAINLPIDGAKLQALRRAAARLEAAERGITFRVTEDGQAIVTGPARIAIPARFERFAQDNGLTLKVERGSANMLPNGKPVATRLGENMPVEYRESGALYYQEMGANQDRTGKTRFSRAANVPTPAERADAIVAKSAATWRPVDAIMRGVTKATRFDKATGFLYDKAAALIDRYTPEQVKAGVVSDYGVPEAVIDRRVMMQGKQRAQIRKTGALLEKLSTLTRAESRLAYEWMNNNDPQAAAYFEAQLPPESVKVMAEIKGMIDALSQEAVDLGQLSPEAFKRNRFEYLHRSYVKHTAELTKGEANTRRRAIAILGEQYKGRGMTDAVDMAKVQNIAPEWWGRKLQDGKADKGLVGEKFVRFERRAPVGEGVMALEQAQGPGETNPQKKGKLLEVAYWPSSEKPPAKFAAWDNAGTWEVRDTKGAKLIVWRDFTKPERMAMGEIDEARYAIAKTLHGMVHDVEVGKYLRWLSQTYAKLPGQPINGEIIEAREMAGFGFAHVFPPGTWVQVPETKVAGTQVAKYGDLAGKFIPGPVWNDVRNVVGTRFKPLGDVYAAVLSGWKTAKTALSPAVHTNNVMANFVMADWHDVSAGHIAKALRILLGASQRDGKGVIGRTGNVASRAGIADAEAAREIIARFQESGANMGSWVNAELQREQLAPLLDALDKEIGTAGQTPGAQVGAFAALQLALRLRFPSAWDAFKPTIAGRALTTEAGSLLDLYEAEDQVFRLAAWLKAKEGGASDIEAGSKARKSFLDYHINAPWIQAMRQTAFPFISFTYRAVPMLLETAARKPHKIMKLALFAGLVNALGYLMSGGDEDDERALLPEEKAGRIWGMVPKLIRMPWNDKHGSPVFLDVRRYVPVGDIFDTGQTHAAVPILPAMQPGGPLMILAELALDTQGFTGNKITLGTDTPIEKAQKLADYLYKGFAPNIVILPGTHAFTGVANAGTGRTDAFGREQSVAQAGLSAFGIKVGSYPADVLRLNATRKAEAEMMEIDRGITNLKREFQRKGIDEEEFRDKGDAQTIKKRGIAEDLQRRLGGGR